MGLAKRAATAIAETAFAGGREMTPPAAAGTVR
jgi:hypothetical protein